MSQQDAPATRPHRGLAHDTRDLAVFKLGCSNLIFVEPGAKLNGAILPRRVADAEATTSDPPCVPQTGKTISTYQDRQQSFCLLRVTPT